MKNRGFGNDRSQQESWFPGSSGVSPPLEGAIAGSIWGSLAVKLKAMSIQTSVLAELLQDQPQLR
ncbi:MAG TPA: hypothetical protein DCY88_32770, partial [Cyanobacteria bacterium UBA11372]|nr:hypothetical protein [Cyanobacteria bacterium UBA11372]